LVIVKYFPDSLRKYLIDSQKRIPMIDKEAIMRKIESLPDADLKKR
jgi:hypothetical protein